MMNYKQRKLYVFRNVLLLLLVVAAITVSSHYGKTILKSAQSTVVPTASAHERWQTNYGKLPLSFEINRGQAPKPVEFLARGDGYNMALLPGEAVLQLSKPKPEANTIDASAKAIGENSAAVKAISATLKIKLAGANKQAHVSGVEPLRGKSNYLIGNDSTKWQTDVPTYAKVKYEGIYPGVDAIFYGNQRQLEYDFIVAPGADPQAIRLDFAGTRSVRLDDNGELVLATVAGEVRQHRPVIYQQINGARQTIEGGYKVKGNQASFELGAYDTTHPLIIDPVVSYATFLGEYAKDAISSIAVDVAGNVYLTGSTTSATYPITFSITPQGDPFPSQARMMFVTKLNAAGTDVIYSTVLNGTKGFTSGSYPEVVSSTGWGIAVDAQGNASAGGYTSTSNFPTTPGAYRTTFTPSKDDQSDALVVRLNAAGNALLASTLIGGSSTDTAAGLAVDPAGNFCLVGNTNSTDFPNSDPANVKVGTEQAVFVARVSADGTMLIHSNVLDAGGRDFGKGITTDTAGNIYITGITPDGVANNNAGSRFPRTPGTFQFPDVVIPGNGRRIDNAFIAKLGSNGKLIFSSVLGSAQPTSITLDRDGNPCIAGFSQFIQTVGNFGSPDYQQFDVFPRTDNTTVQQDSPTLGPQTGGQMLLKLNAAGTNVLVSHRFGYPTDEAANGIAVDAQGFIHVTGYTWFGFISPDGPVVLEDLSQAYPYDVGRNYAFHLKFTPDGKTVAGVDFLPSAQGRGIALDPAGNVYILGWAGGGFKATPGAMQTKLPDGPQPVIHFVAKLGNAINPGATPTPTPTMTPGPAFTISGRITTLTGHSVSGAKVYLHGTLERTLTTGLDGRYSFANLPQGGSYTVDGTSSGTALHPSHYVFQSLDANKVVDFVTRPAVQALTTLSAASYSDHLAADSIVTAFGVNLATTTEIAMTSPLPTQLAGTSIKVRDALGVERLAPLFFVSSTQVNYLTPAGTAAGTAIVTVTNGNGTISGAMTEVESVAPGLFTADASGRGLASAVVFRVKANGEQSYEPVAMFDSSQSKMVGVPIDPGPQGDQVFLLLFGTGFRNNSGMNNVTAQLGGASAQASFAGAQGGFAGLDQANVLLPRSLAGRGEVNLVLSVDGKAANTVKLWIK